MKSHMSLVIEKAAKTSNKISITFDGRGGSIKSVRHLIQMCIDGDVILTNDDMVILTAIAQRGAWITGCPRKFTVTLTETFNETWFTGHMSDSLEDVQVAF